MNKHRRTGSVAAAYAGWVPLACIMAAILLIAGSAISWVTSPNWGKHNAMAPARNVGTVPTTIDERLVALVSPDMIEIPRLGAKAPIVKVGTEPGGELQIPLNPRIVGWWQYGAKPGASKGTAILAGHINYAGVDGVLAQIGTLNPGDIVWIDGIAAGQQKRVEFKITGVRTYEKKALPYQEIFNQQSAGRVAIVTCGGPFDARTGNYLDNIVAYAVLA